VSISPLDNPLPGEPHLTFVLQYNDKPDGTGNWLPYTMMARVQEIAPRKYNNNWRNGNIGWFLNFIGAHPDARTDRFSNAAGELNSSGSTYNFQWSGDDTLRPTPVLTSQAGDGKGGLSYMMPDSSLGFTYQNPVLKSGVWTAYLLDYWAWNLPVTDGAARFWYADPDGVVRPADAWRTDYTKSDVGDGVMLYNYDQLTASKDRRRPVIMNRPFRSVGELGAVYRDQPFKTLDLWSEKSADSALLDLFCVSDASTEISAGRVNINSATPSTLRALVSGAAKQIVKYGTNQIDDPVHNIIRAADEAPAIAQAITGEIAANGPILNSADLVKRLGTPIYNGLSSLPANNTSTAKPIDNKLYGEAPIRVLADLSTTRSWNLLVDVVAQAGRIGPSAVGMQDFIVEGERRYWVHLCIDRFTGEILSQQMEPFTE